MPSEPVSIAASSDRMSPNRLSVTMTSNCLRARGPAAWRSCRRTCGSSSTSGYSSSWSLLDLLAPQDAGLHDVGLLDRTDTLAALARPGRRRRGRCGRSRRRVDLGVDAAAAAVGQGLDAARLAEIDAAGEFADDHDVERPRPSRASGTRRRPARRTPPPGAGWRTGRCPCAGAGGRAPGSASKGRSSHFGPPTAPNSTASAASASAMVSSVQRRALGVDRRAADQAFVDRRSATPRWRSSQSMTRRTSHHHLRADAVTRQDQQLLIGGHVRSSRSVAPRVDQAPQVISRRARAARPSAAPRSRRLAGAFCRVRPMSSRPSSRQSLAERVDLEGDLAGHRRAGDLLALRDRR